MNVKQHPKFTGKLIGESLCAQTVEELSTFYETPKGSLPCSQEPATSPYPKPDELNPKPSIPVSLRSILI
jgi:hypothetical protein